MTWAEAFVRIVALVAFAVVTVAFFRTMAGGRDHHDP